MSALDNSGELTLTLEVADVLDELKMIRNLVVKQREILKDIINALRELNPSQGQQEVSGDINFVNNTMSNNGLVHVQLQGGRTHADDTENIKLLAKGISGPARDHLIQTEEDLVSIISQIDAIKDDVEFTHRMVSGVTPNPVVSWC